MVSGSENSLPPSSIKMTAVPLFMPSNEKELEAFYLNRFFYVCRHSGLDLTTLYQAWMEGKRGSDYAQGTILLWLSRRLETMIPSDFPVDSSALIKAGFSEEGATKMLELARDFTSHFSFQTLVQRKVFTAIVSDQESPFYLEPAHMKEAITSPVGSFSTHEGVSFFPFALNTNESKEGKPSLESTESFMKWLNEPQNPGYLLYYPTSFTQGMEIVTGGAGRMNDFSDSYGDFGRGCYLYKEFSTAVWVASFLKDYSEPSAILVYRMDGKEKGKGKLKQYLITGDEWEEQVELGKETGKVIPKLKKEKPDVITGMALRTDVEEEFLGLQFCFRSDRALEVLSERFDCVLLLHW